MIASARGIVRGRIAASEGLWQHRMDRSGYFGPELMGKSLGILGFGNKGRVVARLARALDMGGAGLRFAAYTAVPEGVEAVDLSTLLKKFGFHLRFMPG